MSDLGMILDGIMKPGAFARVLRTSLQFDLQYEAVAVTNESAR